MNLHYAVLRLFLCKDIADATEPCLAYRLPFDVGENSQYWQMVQETENDPYKPEVIHGIIPESKAADFLCQVKETGRDITWLGTTYCVEPYALGFAHVGRRDKEIRKNSAISLSMEEGLVNYIKQWAWTEEGFDHIVQTIALADEKGRVAPRSSKTRIDGRYDLVNDYINNFYKKKDFPERMQEHGNRMDEFVMMVQPLTKDEVDERAMDFYDAQRKRKIGLYIHAREYAQTAPLLQLGQAA